MTREELATIGRLMDLHAACNAILKTFGEAIGPDREVFAQVRPSADMEAATVTVYVLSACYSGFSTFRVGCGLFDSDPKSVVMKLRSELKQAVVFAMDKDKA